MAEGFANHYGSDVLWAESRGLSPTATITQDTVEAMAEKNIDISRHVPKFFDPLEALSFDLIVNMSGYALPGPPRENLLEWTVEDPYRRPKEIYDRVCQDLENRVMRLILDLRKKQRTA